MKLTIIAKIRETRTRFLQPTRSQCIPDSLHRHEQQENGHREDRKKMSKTGRDEAIFVKAIISLLLCALVSTFGFVPPQISIGPTSRGRIATRLMSTSEPIMLRSTSCLTSSAAQVAIDAACRVASDNEWKVTIAVSDAGGVPIFVDGACVGAVGVSGVKPDEDEMVATAAADALSSITSKM